MTAPMTTGRGRARITDRAREERRLGWLLCTPAVVVMIAVTLAASLTYAFKARSTGEQTVATARSIDLVMEALRSDLQSALPPSRGRLAGAFEGSA